MLYIKNRNIKYYRKSCCFSTLHLEISLQFQRFKALKENESFLYVRCTDLSQYVHTCVYLLSTSESLLSRAVSFCLICLLFREKSSIHVHMFFCILTMFTGLARNGCTSGRYYPKMQSIERTEPEISSLCWSE